MKKYRKVHTYSAGDKVLTVDVTLRGRVDAVVTLAPAEVIAVLALAFAAIAPVEVAGVVVVLCTTRTQQQPLSLLHNGKSHNTNKMKRSSGFVCVSLCIIIGANQQYPHAWSPR